MGYMEAFAKDLELSVPDMLRQVFIRRCADDIAHAKAYGSHSVEFLEDRATAHLADKWGPTMMMVVLVDNYMENKYKVKAVSEVQ